MTRINSSSLFGFWQFDASLHCAALRNCHWSVKTYVKNVLFYIMTFGLRTCLERLEPMCCLPGGQWRWLLIKTTTKRLLKRHDWHSRAVSCVCIVVQASETRWHRRLLLLLSCELVGVWLSLILRVNKMASTVHWRLNFYLSADDNQSLCKTG